MPFHGRGRGGKQHLQRRFLRKRGAAGERLLPLGGAVAQRLRGYGWRSEKSVKAIAPTGAALAFLCFDFFFRIVKGEQPLARCGVGGVQRQGGGSRNTPPCLWPSGASLHACGKQIPLPAAPLQMLLFSRKKITERPQTFRYAEMYNNF